MFNPTISETTETFSETEAASTGTFAYTIDDRNSETGIGRDEAGIGSLNFGDLMWLNQFTVFPEANVIKAISLAWGTPVRPAFTISGKPIIVALYQDPNDDGDPSDAVLLATASAQVTNPNTDQFVTVPIAPTTVSGSFFVGALFPNLPFLTSPWVAPLDTTEPMENRSWFTTAAGGSFNIDNLSANGTLTLTEDAGFSGNWLLRAEAEIDPLLLEIAVDTTIDELDGDTSSIFSLRDNPGGTGISLREAIVVANNTIASSIVIKLTGGQTYDLEIDGVGNDVATSGDLDINPGNLTILAVGNGTATIDANGLDRVFDVLRGATLTLENITVTGGVREFVGGGISNNGILTLTNSFVVENSGTFGGGIYNAPSGKVTLIDSVVSGNNASSDGGGIFNNSQTESLATDLLGEIDLIRSTVSNNTADQNGGGIASFIGIVALTDSTVEKNLAVADGGGIAMKGTSFTVESDPASSLTLTNSTISGNRASGSGGGISSESKTAVDDTVTIINTTLSNNTAEVNGGGISNQEAKIILIDSTVVRENTAAANGGGIYSSGLTSEAIVEKSIVSDNNAGTGGGIYSGFSSNTIVYSSSISYNKAVVDGGGLVSDTGARTDLLNSTVSGNRANNNGGGIYNQPFLAAVDPLSGTIIGTASFGGTTNLHNSTVTENIGNGGGIANLKFTSSNIRAASGIVNAQNSIIAGNSSTDISGSVNGNNNNLLGNLKSAEGSIGSGSDIVEPNPGLAPLADNGGPTLTHALLPSSRAIDAGNNAKIFPDQFDLDDDGNKTEPFPFDQRRLERIFDGNADGVAIVDIGAFEFAGAEPEPEPKFTLNLGTTGDDILDLSTSSTEQVLFSGTGNDQIQADDTSQNLRRLYTGTGDDVVKVGSNQRVFGGDGNDVLDASVGGSGNRLYGGDGNDNLIANSNTLLAGGAGTDIFLFVEGDNGAMPQNNTIIDFKDDEDKLKLSGSLSLEQLTIGSDSNDNATISRGDDLIATLLGIDKILITAADFT